MPVLTLSGLDGVRARVGEELGVSDWREISQDDVNAFADVTGDHQWIHVDVERAKETPFGGTIVHGYFTLSLGPVLSAEIYTIDGVAMALNYGAGKVRFPSPLPVGSKVRMRATLAAAEDVAGGLQITVVHTFEREGGDKPVCVAETLVRIYGG